MAEISKKELINGESNIFLINSGFINVSNSMEQSCWKHPEINLILALPLDEIVKTKFQLWALFYKLGKNSGYKEGVTKTVLKNI